MYWHKIQNLCIILEVVHIEFGFFWGISLHNYNNTTPLEVVMKCNVGKTDRILRIGAGLLIVGWGIVGNTWWGAVGLIPLTTGLLRWCPLYVPFKVKT
jgi:hypothetical protein